MNITLNPQVEIVSHLGLVPQPSSGVNRRAASTANLPGWTTGARRFSITKNANPGAHTE